jgi:protein-tyrosine-phosphatase
MPSAMRIHFVCTGNIYRSRLAEAYCASKSIPGVHVSSSGIAAGRNEIIPISPYAAEVLNRFGLDSWAAKRWQRTTAALVQTSDVLVFMEAEHHRFCESWIDPARQRIEIWDIEDLGPIPAVAIPEKVELTFRMIRQRADTLLASLECSNATA